MHWDELVQFSSVARCVAAFNCLVYNCIVFYEFIKKVAQIMLKLHTENEKTKPENPGLEGRLNPGFGFEKMPGYPGFRVR